MQRSILPGIVAVLLFLGVVLYSVNVVNMAGVNNLNYTVEKSTEGNNSAIFRTRATFDNWLCILASSDTINQADRLFYWLTGTHYDGDGYTAAQIKSSYADYIGVSWAEIIEYPKSTLTYYKEDIGSIIIFTYGDSVWSDIVYPTLSNNGFGEMVNNFASKGGKFYLTVQGEDLGWDTGQTVVFMGAYLSSSSASYPDLPEIIDDVLNVWNNYASIFSYAGLIGDAAEYALYNYWHYAINKYISYYDAGVDILEYYSYSYKIVKSTETVKVATSIAEKIGKIGTWLSLATIGLQVVKAAWDGQITSSEAQELATSVVSAALNWAVPSATAYIAGAAGLSATGVGALVLAAVVGYMVLDWYVQQKTGKSIAEWIVYYGVQGYYYLRDALNYIHDAWNSIVNKVGSGISTALSYLQNTFKSFADRVDDWFGSVWDTFFGFGDTIYWVYQ